MTRSLIPPTRACSARLYSTTGGQAPGGSSKLPLAQAVKKIIAITRTAAGRLQYLALNGIGTLLLIKPLGGASCALTLAADVQDEQGDGKRDKCMTRSPPRPRPDKDPGQCKGNEQPAQAFETTASKIGKSCEGSD